MSAGKMAILLNLDSIYESLYDALNQVFKKSYECWQEGSTTKYC